MPVPTNLAASAAVATVAATATLASAHVTPLTIDQVVNQADRIVIGDVVGITATMNPLTKVIHSHVDLAVTDSLKGAGPAVFTLTVLGGTVDDTTMRTCISPTFLEGDHVLLCLESDPPRIVGAFQGAYLVDGQEAVRMGTANQRFLPAFIMPFENLIAEIDRALPGDPAEITEYQGNFSLQGGVGYVLADCNWAYQANPMGESFRINPNCVDAGCGPDEDLLDAILAGAAVWADAGADFSFNYGGLSQSTNAPSLNSLNLVVFDNAFDAPGGEDEPSAIAVTFFWCSGNNMIEWDLVYNDFDFNFWNGIGSCLNRYDVQGIGAHEFGHALGLGHSQFSDATMWASSFACNIAQRSLHFDDIDGVQAIYGFVDVSNDTCTAAATIAEGFTDFSNLGANSEGFGEPCGTIPNDVWYRYTASCTGDVLVRLCSSTVDTELAVYEASCPNGPNQSIACNDDDCGTRSQLTYQAVQGVDYLIRVGGAEDLLNIFIGCTPEPCPADTNGDDEIDVQDLTYVILNWDTADPDADINDDGVVDVQDLTEVILAWGPC